jgi:hypothetical protein
MRAGVEEARPVCGLRRAVAQDELLHHLPGGVVGELQPAATSRRLAALARLIDSLADLEGRVLASDWHQTLQATLTAAKCRVLAAMGAVPDYFSGVLTLYTRSQTGRFERLLKR